MSRAVVSRALRPAVLPALLTTALLNVAPLTTALLTTALLTTALVTVAPLTTALVTVAPLTTACLHAGLMADGGVEQC